MELFGLSWEDNAEPQTLILSLFSEVAPHISTMTCLQEMSLWKPLQSKFVESIIGKGNQYQMVVQKLRQQQLLQMLLHQLLSRFILRIDRIISLSKNDNIFFRERAHAD